MSKHVIRAVILITATVFSASLLAQTELSDAARLLKQKLSGLTSFSGHFTQRVTDINGEILQQAQGNMTLAVPDLMRWQVTEPDDTLLIADGDTLWHVDPFVEQVTALSQRQAISNNPIVLLTSPDNEHWQQYQVSVDNDVFDVTSNNPEGQIVALKISFADNALSRLVLIDRQQQVSEFVFSEQRMNENLDSSLFSFTLPDGYSLDDQRSE
ncbi:outer membrane lipoprotein chaperone LolA [Aestuariibacter salexigens]|uniref:outer membrane lipoprotein chaperone LolA n=1 Tax=Aestuariibacter salexigens TaxID=226010 RepID=UPI00041A2EE7|nr:outer membrane lipoprotein chaperone LolA [Aestuariibacter salexigens]